MSANAHEVWLWCKCPNCQREFIDIATSDEVDLSTDGFTFGFELSCPRCKTQITDVQYVQHKRGCLTW